MNFNSCSARRLDFSIFYWNSTQSREDTKRQKEKERKFFINLCFLVTSWLCVKIRGAEDGKKDKNTSALITNDLHVEFALKLAWRMLFDDYNNYEQSEFGVNLLFALKKHNPGVWESDWRHDTLLGIACGSHYKYDERYEAFKRAYDKAEKIKGDDHPGLLISLAACYNAPGPPVISEDDAIALVTRAMSKKIYLDGAWELSSLYHTKGDIENRDCSLA